MNCQIFETVVNDLAREQMMEANAREDALAHTDICEACSARLSLERRLTFGLSALATEMNSVSASSRVVEQLLAAFRCQTSVLPQTQRANRTRYWLAAAAVVLIAFGLAGMKLGLNGPSQTTLNTSGKGDAPTPAESPIAIDRSIPETVQPEKQALYQPRRKQSARSSGKPPSVRNENAVAQVRPGRKARPAVGNPEVNEVTTQFLPLSYASPLSLQDGGQLVRVEMPRSAMVSLGLPVNMERYSEKVKADVLVSADGLARAIRFVQ